MDHHAHGAAPAAGGGWEFSLLIPYLIIILIVTPLMVWLLARRARKQAELLQDIDGGTVLESGAAGTRHRYDLLRLPLVYRLLRHRAFQFAVQLPNALIFALVVAAGIWGTQAGDRNFATVITWLIWWAVIIFTFLLLSRTWCMACPLVSFAEWLQRGKLWGVGRRVFSMNRKWPRRLRNFWVPTAFFIILTWMYLFLGLASNPLYTAVVTLGLFIVPAIVVSLLFERRTFCRYVCPIGGIIGAYSMTAPLELRVRDTGVCQSCREKACYKGSDKGYGCPMFEWPQKMDTNIYCVLCTECVKTCPNDNIALNARPFLSDLWKTRKVGFDVAAIVVILLGVTVFQTLDMVEPWTDASAAMANATGLGEQTVLTLSYIVLAVLAPMLIFSLWSWITTRVGGKGASLKSVFIAFSFAFLPIALTSHLAHNLVHFFEEGAAVVPVLSDPFGWGWNLFGTANVTTIPLLGMEPLRFLQMTMVLIGYVAAVYVGWRAARQTFGDSMRTIAGLAPMLVLMVAFAAVNLWLLNLPMGMREG
ncbi:MAG: 4Fe-4S binding protein [Gaiellales bacterium]|nr:MAG: 4Fe-4S binding protein [Gaiellales bacterium]